MSYSNGQALDQERKRCEEASQSVKRSRMELRKLQFKPGCADPEFRLGIHNFSLLLSEGITALLDAKVGEYEWLQRTDRDRGKLRQAFFRSLAEHAAWVIVALVVLAIATVWRIDALADLIARIGGTR